MRRTKKTSEDKQIFRYWIEIRELASGSVRKLPLTAVLKVCLARRKKNEPPVPNDELLHLQDGNETLQGASFDELRTRLRQEYPDAAYERTLHYERDREAEERRERALSGLIELIVEQMVKEHLEPCATRGACCDGSDTRRERDRGGGVR
jgi:hypothetical protein